MVCFKSINLIIMKTDKGKIADKEIIEQFGDTHSSYTLMEKRELLKNGVLDALCWYASGYTLTEIMKSMKLLNSKGEVLSRGRYFLWNTYR